MELLLAGLLIAVLIAATIAFAVLGVLGRRRRRRLGRIAHERMLQFSHEGLPEILPSLREFAIVQAGHSYHASNVAHGRAGAWAIRAFDFRYELGHGTRRVTRYCDVLVLEAPAQLPQLLLWHIDDMELAPLIARISPQQVEKWACHGDPQDAQRLIEALELASRPKTSVQTVASTLLMCRPTHLWAAGYGDWLDELERIISRLEEMLRPLH